MSVDELDLRHLPKGQRLQDLSAHFTALPVGGEVILIGRRGELDELREVFDRDWSGAYEWWQLTPGPDADQDSGASRDRVIKVAAAMVPRVLVDAIPESAAGAREGRGGAVWRLQPSGRQLDANIIHLSPGDRIDAPTGSDLDVLMLVLQGDGELNTEVGPAPLDAGQLAWLPRGSQRSIVAAASGLSYLTVHVRRPPMGIGSAANQPAPAQAG